MNRFDAVSTKPENETEKGPKEQEPAGRSVETGELRPIGAVAKELGLTTRAIRYYEEIGLLRPAVRVKGSNRYFDDSDVLRLQRIKQLREFIGFSLAEIADLLDGEEVRLQLSERYHGTTDPAIHREVVRDAIALAKHRLELVERRIAQVEAVRQEELQHLEQLEAKLADLGEAGPDAGHDGSNPKPNQAVEPRNEQVASH